MKTLLFFVVLWTGFGFIVVRCFLFNYFTQRKENGVLKRRFRYWSFIRDILTIMFIIAIGDIFNIIDTSVIFP